VTCVVWWFYPGTSVFSTNKTDRHDITEILLKVALNTITLILTIYTCQLFCFKTFIFITVQHQILSQHQLQVVHLMTVLHSDRFLLIPLDLQQISKYD